MIEGIVALWMMWSWSQGDAALRETIGGDYCDGVRAGGESAELEKLGEPARRVLLEMAAGGGLDAGCAFEHLANLNDARVLPAIRKSLDDESELMPVRRQAAAFAGLLGDVASLDAILELLASDDYGTMVSCLSALGGIDDEKARLALRSSLADASFELVRPTVIRSIGRQRDARAMGALETLAFDAQLLASPGTGSRLRSELALAFARIGTVRAHERAVSMLEGIGAAADKRVAIRDVGREIRRQMNDAVDPDRVARMDAHLTRLAAMYRATEP